MAITPLSPLGSSSCQRDHYGRCACHAIGEATAFAVAVTLLPVWLSGNPHTAIPGPPLKHLLGRTAATIRPHEEDRALGLRPWPPDVNEGYVGLLKPHVAPEKRLHGFGLAEQAIERDRLDGLRPPYPLPRGKTAEVIWERAATLRNAKGTCRIRLRHFFQTGLHQTGRHSLESGKIAYQLFQAIRPFVQDADLLAETLPHDAGAVNNFIVAAANSL